MLKILILLPFTLYSLSAYSLSVGTGALSGMFRITPVVGYEQVQKNYPTPHTVNRFYYGVGIEAGPRLLSVELQATQGEDTESYSGTDIKETTKKASLGIKSYFALASMLQFYFRAGAQGKDVTTDTTVSGVTTTEKSAFYVDPYVGTGLTVSLASMLNLSLGLTAVFSDYPNKGKIEYQTSFGFGLRF